MSDPETDARRARIKELLAIPDRERSDAEWDELNELEIMMAVSSRQAMPRPDMPRGGNGGGGQGGNRPRHGGGGNGGQHPNNPNRKFHNRPPRRRPPGR
jgi:hypothetical protein